MKTLLTQFYQALPLILSDTQDPKDISLLRIIAVITFIVILVSPLLTYVTMGANGLSLFYEYWKDLLTFLGATVLGKVVQKFSKGG